MVGEAIGYWQFFPATEPGWGNIPVWATGEVIDSFPMMGDEEVGAAVDRARRTVPDLSLVVVGPRGWGEVTGIDREEFQRISAVMSEQGRIQQAQLQLHGGHGRPLWVELNAHWVEGEGGQRRIEGMVSDISLRRQAEAELTRHREHLEDLVTERTAELSEAKLRAESANQAKGRFLATMSHEFRTPLNAILGFTQLMQMDANEPLPASQRTRAQQIAQAGWHLLEMINDTLDLSRIESGSLRLDLKPLDLPPLLARALALVQGQASERGLAISQRIDAGAASIMGDATRVTQILTNLLSNAVKYNHAGGSISLTASCPQPGWVEIAVRDTGIGLTDEQRGALFQPFNRLGRESTGLPGTGIGLVISQRLAEMMGGSLRAEAVPDGPGACFVLRLTAAETPSIPSAEGAPELPADRHAVPRQRVLYVEDNPMNAEVMRGIQADNQSEIGKTLITVSENLRTGDEATDAALDLLAHDVADRLGRQRS